MLLDRIDRLPSMRVLAVFFLALGLLVYGYSAISNDFVKFDDDMLITENPAVQSLEPGAFAWAFTHFDPELYIPLTFVSYQIDHGIAGLRPEMFHLTNLLLHILNAFLVFLLLGGLTGDRRIGLLGGLLFLLHPLHVEAVAWASGRKDLLSTCFFLASTLSYMKYASEGSRRGYVGSLLFFLLGLLSKVSILLTPVLFLGIDWVQGRRPTLKDKIPHLLLTIAFGIVAVVGKQNILHDSPLGSMILMAAKSTVFYLGKLLIPYPLSVIYPFREEITLASSDFLLPLLLLTILTITVLSSLRFTRWIAFGAGWFLLMLLPSFTNFAKAGEVFFASDRYAYVPSIGLFLLVGLGIVWLLRSRPSFTKILEPAIAAILIIFAVVSLRQTTVWASTNTLFTNVLAHYDDSPLALNKVGSNKMKQGDLEGAFDLFERSIALKPTARAYYNMGVIYLTRSDYDKALEANLKAVELDPEHAWAHVNLGYLYARQRNHEKAAGEYERALEIDPKDVETMINLASMYMSIGRNADAHLLAKRGLKIAPDNKDLQTLVSAFEEKK
jgi:Flp pilus assembly protein TadD